MKKTFLTILFVSMLFFAGCKSSNETTSEPSGIDVFGLTDETEDAAKIIREINENQLKQIKGIYKNSQEQFEELKTAMKNNETDKVKKLAGELADKIDEGMNLGKESIEKIEDAQKLKINSTYREYLSLKESSMKKELSWMPLASGSEAIKAPSGSRYANDQADPIMRRNLDWK